MWLTKRMEQLLDRRAELASELSKVSAEIDKFIANNGIQDIEHVDYDTGVEVFTNLYASAERVKDAIRNHKK